MYVSRGVTFVSGKGPYLISDMGARYLDFMSNYGVSIFGYNHAVLHSHLHTQLDALTVLHSSFGSPVRTRAAYKLLKKVVMTEHMVFFSNSGTEAVEAALKFALVYTKRGKLASCTGSYHGKTLGSLAVTSGEKYRDPFISTLSKATFVPFNDVSALQQTLDESYAAFIIEPVQGETGIVPVSEEFLQEARKLCSKYGIVLIFDEVQCGTGRTGTFTYTQRVGIVPDMMCLGKGLAGGLPVGATIVSKHIAESIPKTLHTSTFGGNPFTCAGIIATLELLDETVLNHVCEMGEYLLTEISAISSKRILAVRGKGLMVGIDLDSGVFDVLKALQKEHILAIPARGNTLRLLPPYIIEKEHIDIFITALGKALQAG